MQSAEGAMDRVALAGSATASAGAEREARLAKASRLHDLAGELIMIGAFLSRERVAEKTSLLARANQAFDQVELLRRDLVALLAEPSDRGSAATCRASGAPPLPSGSGPMMAIAHDDDRHVWSACDHLHVPPSAR